MLTKSEISTEIHPVKSRSEPTIALLLWGDAFDDFLDSIGVSLEAFCTEGPGGWVLGYIEALRLVGVRTVLILISARVDAPVRFQHAPSGATISVLPASKSYRAIRRQMVHPYPSLCTNFKDLFGEVRGGRRFLLKILHPLASYLATPLGLLADELLREGCRAIFCQEYEYARFDTSVLLGYLMRLPVFATFQGGTNDWNPIGRFVRSVTIKRCTGLVIGTQTEIQRVSDRYHIQSTKIGKIFNPVDLRMWGATDRSLARTMFGLPTGAEVVVWHGRVDIQTKGLDILLDAWEKICSEREGRDMWLLLMGTGQDSETLRQRIADLPIKNVKCIDKYVTDRGVLRSFLSSGDVYAFPSRHEGFAVAPIEAMACGLPIVAAAAPGVPDLLEGGEDSGGLMVPRDDVAAFAQALSRVLDDRVLRFDLSKRARRRVEQCFSLEAVGKQLRDFLLQSKIMNKPHQYRDRAEIPPIPQEVSRPLWSVMIPTYNCANYLRETLTSVLAQDPGSEIMQIEVVDDYSTKDDPKAVVEELGKGRVKFFRQPKNVGHTKNFETCLRRSSGRLIHLLHGDDCVKIGFYYKMQLAFNNNPCIGAAFCRPILIDEYSNSLGEWKLEEPESGILNNWLERIAVEQCIQTPSIVVRREVYQALGGFDRRLSWVEDWEMWVRIALHYPVWYEVEPLALYRVHSSSNSSRYLKTGENTRDLRRAIDIMQIYLPSAVASKLSRQARENWALYTIQFVLPELLATGHLKAVTIQIQEALKLSCSLVVMAELNHFILHNAKHWVKKRLKHIMGLKITDG